MKTIELFIMLIGVTFGISKFAYGQVYSPNTYIYEDISGDDWYILLKLAGDKAFMILWLDIDVLHPGRMIKTDGLIAPTMNKNQRIII